MSVKIFSFSRFSRTIFSNAFSRNALTSPEHKSSVIDLNDYLKVGCWSVLNKAEDQQFIKEVQSYDIIILQARNKYDDTFFIDKSCSQLNINRAKESQYPNAGGIRI